MNRMNQIMLAYLYNINQIPNNNYYIICMVCIQTLYAQKKKVCRYAVSVYWNDWLPVKQKPKVK